MVPPCVTTVHPLSFFFTSIATTTHCLPKFSAHSVIILGFITAAELIDTLSAPAFSAFLISSTDDIPPPTQRGTVNLSAVSVTMLSIVFLPSTDAEMSKNVTSSAP